MSILPENLGMGTKIRKPLATIRTNFHENGFKAFQFLLPSSGTCKAESAEVFIDKFPDFGIKKIETDFIHIFTCSIYLPCSYQVPPVKICIHRKFMGKICTT
jgi:hypothetical protein